jgi:hypothetical protein
LIVTDWLWWLATSDGVLSLIALVLVVAFVVGHIPLADRFPVIGPCVVLARFVALLALGLLCFLVGGRIADERAAVAKLKSDLAWSNLQLDAQKSAAADADRLRKQAEADASAANQKVIDYENKLASQPAGCGCALDDADVDSLRNIAR